MTIATGKRAVLHPDKLANTGAYSAAVVCSGWLYVSGHASIDLKSGKLINGDIEEQTNHTLDSIGKVLAEAGCTFEDVVKCTCHLARIEDFDRFDKAYSKRFRGVPPARTTVQAGLGDGLKIEIDAIAYVPSKKKRR